MPLSPTQRRKKRGKRKSLRNITQMPEQRDSGRRRNKPRWVSFKAMSLCNIQQIEEVKCLVRIVPIWASNIICFLSIAQLGTFMPWQALKMELHLGPKFKIPPGSVSVLCPLTLAIWVPIYDRIVVPWLRRITKHEAGITLLQRIGIGMLLSILSMVVAGIVEKKRRDWALEHAKPLSVFWLAPQLILMGFCEAFNVIGQIEFYYKQFPEQMKSIGNSLFSCTMGGANYLSSLIVVIVPHKTRKHMAMAGWTTTSTLGGLITSTL